jgi:hypothetical protein
LCGTGWCAPTALVLGLSNTSAGRSSSNRSVTVRLTLHAKYWLDNRSGLDLLVKDLDQHLMHASSMLPGGLRKWQQCSYVLLHRHHVNMQRQQAFPYSSWGCYICKLVVALHPYHLLLSCSAVSVLITCCCCMLFVDAACTSVYAPSLSSDATAKEPGAAAGPAVVSAGSNSMPAASTQVIRVGGFLHCC